MIDCKQALAVKTGPMVHKRSFKPKGKKTVSFKVKSKGIDALPYPKLKAYAIAAKINGVRPLAAAGKRKNKAGAGDILKGAKKCPALRKKLNKGVAKKYRI